MSEKLKARGRLNALRRKRPADDPEVLAATAELKAAGLAEHVERVVATFPPLTDEQVSRVVALLRPASAEVGAA